VDGGAKVRNRAARLACPAVTRLDGSFVQEDIEVFDLVTMRFNPTFTANTFSDPNIVNGYYPTGVTGDLAAGKVAIVLSGPDKGDVVTVESVTSSTEFTLANPWKITPNSGDIVIICDPAKAPEIKGARVTVPKSGTTGIVAAPRIENLSAGRNAGQVHEE